VEFAEGEAGDGGVFVGAVDLGDELLGDGGDERVCGALGEGDDFGFGRCDRDPVVKAESDEAGVPGFENFFQSIRGLNAERTFEGEREQVLVAALADEFVELRNEEVEARVVGETEGEIFPEKPVAGDFLDGRNAAASEGYLEDVSWVISLAFREPVDFGSAAVPGFWADLFGSMPIAEGEVVELVRRQA